MKKYLLLPILLCSFFAQAQMLHLKNGSFIPKENIETLKDFSQWSKYEYNNSIYCIVQFSHSISQSERELVSKQTGIQFFEYMPRWAFFASVPKNINIQNLAQYSIKSIVPYEAQNKITNKLVERPLPTWVVKSNGQIEILVDIFDNISKQDAENFFLQNAIQFIKWENELTAKVQIDESKLNTVAQLAWVKLLQPTSAPTVLENLTERSNHRVNTIDNSYTSGLHYDGTGVAVSIGDDGVIGPHIDFKGRVTMHTLNDNGTHCDHVSGIVAGGGNFDPITSGNGRGADLHIYDDYDNILNASADYTGIGVRILSNSLGQGCNDGYTSNSKTIDALIRSKPSLMSVHSSGNSGSTTCGGVGQGFFTITGGYKAGKNVIAVGNVLNDDALAPSSSRGPSADGRIKPDLVATGTDVYSTQPDNTYDTFTGTSMACPGVSGTLASLWNAYRATHANADPYSALMKALVMNTADDLGNKGPDFKYGYGRINARRAFQVMNNNQYIIDSVDNGITKDFTIVVPTGTLQMKVMLYWADVEGNPASSVVLVNDLNLTVEDDNAIIFKPWVLNNSANVVALNSNATTNRDSLNNVEQVTIDYLQAGNYILHVNGYDVPQGPQKFVLVYEFLDEAPVLTYPKGGESFVSGITERIRWDAYANNLGTFKLEYSSDAGTTWNSIANNVAANKRFYDWTPPATLNTGKMLVKVTRGSLSSVCDTLFSILGVPTGLTVDTACGNTFHLKWDALANAEGYKIYMLGPKYMEEIGTSGINEFYVTTGVNLIDTFYFAVAGIRTTNGANGLRCIAYRKLPGEVNCLDDAYNVETTIPFNNVYSCASSNQVPVTVKVKNIGFRDLVNMPIYYQVNANPVVSEFIPATILIGDYINYTFTALANLSAAGTYTIKTWTHLLGDINNSNDTSMVVANIFAPTVLTAPTIEEFEGVTFPPTGWKVLDNDNSVKWQKTLCMQGANGGNTHAAYMDFFNYNNIGQIDDLETAQIDLTGVTTDSAIVTFDLAHAYGTEYDTLSVLVSNDCTVSYNSTGYTKSGAALATAGMMTNIFSPTLQNQWRNDQVDLSNYIGQKVFLRFRGINKSGNNVYLDNINVILKNVTPLSIENANSVGNVSVYPNPSEGNYILEFNSTTSKLVGYTIMDVSGQKIKQSQFNVSAGTTKMAINITDLPSGIYMLELKDGVHTQQIKLSKY